MFWFGLGRIKNLSRGDKTWKQEQWLAIFAPCRAAYNAAAERAGTLGQTGHSSHTRVRREAYPPAFLSQIWQKVLCVDCCSAQGSGAISRCAGELGPLPRPAAAVVETASARWRYAAGVSVVEGSPAAPRSGVGANAAASPHQSRGFSFTMLLERRSSQ